MFTRITQRFAIAALLAVLFAPVALKLGAQDQSPQPGRFVAHEWGTFTSLFTADGKAQLWNPLGGPSELPSFVYRSSQARQCFKGRGMDLALVRMETPVIYFYSDRDVRASVKVDFPRGCFSEWYPLASTNRQTIDWNGFVAQPGATENFPVDKSRSHYYPARETDAAPLSFGDEQKVEQEKFLFYRGFGNFDLPLSVRLKDDQVIVRSAWPYVIAKIILFENREGGSGWRIHGPLAGEATIARPALDQPVEPLLRELEKTLVGEGLYEKEAAAMVKTWRDSWFEEGLRVFYILPRRATDSILPITIKPQPSELARVFVGRAEIITPEMETEIRAAAQLFGENSPEARKAAINSVRRYGRFADPVLREARKNAKDDASHAVIDELMAAVAKPVGKR
ncbi:MAG TPA: hypothetical protein VHR27_02350 [Blastocatellia bacterium]|nr:hypothetical protein [Blastocatellia bacterium]